MDLRQNKRYQLKAFVTFSWEHSDGGRIQGEGYTRDISPAGVFVLTSDPLPQGTTVKLEVILPSLREKQSGASLRTQGRVVRSEEVGFAAVAEMGFRMRFTEKSSSEQSLSEMDRDGKHEASGKGTGKGTGNGLEPISRFWM